MSLQVFEEGVGRADVGIGGASGGGTVGALFLFDCYPQ
jgi:hypothetical protein